MLAKAVKVTLGPRGRNVVLDKKWGSPTITKDGVTVAKEITLEDPYQNMGAQMVREVASKTSDVAGDGTTTATVLAEAIYREGLRNVTAGANPMYIKRGIDKAVDRGGRGAEAALQGREGPRADHAGRHASPPTATPRSATSSPTPWTRSARTARSRSKRPSRWRPPSSWSRGCSSTTATSRPYFITEKETMEVVLENAYVLIHEKKISEPEGHPSAAGEDLPGRQAAAHHRRGRRGRGPGHPGGEQAARHAPGLRGEGAGLRRSPQGHARGHRHPDRRHGHQRGPGPQARERRALQDLGKAKRITVTQGQHHHHRGRRQGAPTSRPAPS